MIKIISLKFLRKLKTVKVSSFGFLFFPFLAFSSEPLKMSPSAQETTEATFSFKCEECKKNQVSVLSEKCSLTIQPEECKDIPEEERAVCGKEDPFNSPDTEIAFKKCLKRTSDSLTSIFNTLLSVAQNSLSSFLKPSEKPSTSSKNYAALEFYKVYRETKGPKFDRAVESASVVGGKNFSEMWNNARILIEEKFKIFDCYKASIKMDILCDIFVSLVLSKKSVPNWARLSVAKDKKQLKGIKKLFHTQKQKESLTAAFDLLNKLERKMLSSALLNNKIRLELKNFFQATNKSQFAKQIQESLSNISQWGRNPGTPNAHKQHMKQVRDIVIAALKTEANSAKLSKNSLSVLLEGVTDAMLITYINKRLAHQIQFIQKK